MEYLKKTLSEYKVIELKEICRELKLPVSGKKEELYNRIRGYNNSGVKKKGKMSETLEKKWDEYVYENVNDGFDKDEFRGMIAGVYEIVLEGKEKKDLREFDNDKELMDSIEGMRDVDIKKFLRPKIVNAFNKIGDRIYDNWKKRK